MATRYHGCETFPTAKKPHEISPAFPPNHLHERIKPFALKAGFARFSII
jgi:hypothetical protein